jgi:chemotaxis protein methyltransferase CheR
MTLSGAQFESLSTLLRQETAVVIDMSKEYLVEARLTQLARDEGFATIADLVDRVLTQRTSALTHRVLLALTTHETSFFRDQAPFEALRTVLLPTLIRARSKTRTLTIWSAGCSSGQEPYSIALLLADSFPELSSWKINIRATDINPFLLQQARTGVYSALEVARGLPQLFLDTYFSQTEDGFQIREDIRARVELSEKNLMKPWSPFTADIIFLRNVLIYFAPSSRKTVLAAIHKTLAADGYLIMGTAESPRHIYEGFTSANVAHTNVFVKT